MAAGRCLRLLAQLMQSLSGHGACGRVGQDLEMSWEEGGGGSERLFASTDG